MKEGIKFTEQKKDKITDIANLSNNLNKGVELMKYSISILKDPQLSRVEVIKRAEHIFNYSRECLERSHEFFVLNSLNKEEIVKDKPDVSLYVFDALHTLKNNFAGIMGFCQEIIEEELESDILNEYFDFINRAIDDSDVLLKKILNYDNFLEDKIVIDLNSNINKIVNNLKQQASLKNINIFNKTEGQNLTLNTYKYKLDSILINLITNAIKFTNQGGNIEISIRKKEDIIEIDVKDNGIGLSVEAQKELFESIGVSTKGTYNEVGTGFGLSICKNMALKMGGDLKVESEGQGKGTTFILNLPIEEKVKNNN